jgi:type IV secretion system protein VirB10
MPAGGVTAAAQASTTAGGGGSRGVLGMQASETPPARAGVLGNRSLVLPQGTSLTCALTTRVVSAQAGFIGCQVLRNVYSGDGRVLLIERGSHLDGEYRVTQVRPGTTRIPALWTRLRTPAGITIELDSPATGPLGESGADATVDNRWFERVGAAMLVSIIDDSIKIVLNNETAPPQGSNPLVFQGTGQTASQMAEKVLDATINLPPLLYANQGGLVGVYVARDIDFSSVYELQPVTP